MRATSSDTSSTTRTFTIAIGDVDEFDIGAVSDTDAAANTVAEDAIVGTAVGITGLASDADATDTVTYSWRTTRAAGLRSTPTRAWSPSTGRLDYETATSHNITIRATSNDGSTSSQAFTINVTDVNEVRSARQRHGCGGRCGG